MTDAHSEGTDVYVTDDETSDSTELMEEEKDDIGLELLINKQDSNEEVSV